MGRETIRALTKQSRQIVDAAIQKIVVGNGGGQLFAWTARPYRS